MSEIEVNIITAKITASTTYENKTSIAVLNSHASDGLRVQQADGTYIVLASGQSVVLTAPTGTTLPNITILTDDTSLEAQIVAS
tara:strand:+ start:755 stop:1006 length:252 start_codon:yes stop_codon:yes gene_type:complete